MHNEMSHFSSIYFKCTKTKIKQINAIKEENYIKVYSIFKTIHKKVFVQF